MQFSYIPYDFSAPEIYHILDHAYRAIFVGRFGPYGLALGLGFGLGMAYMDCEFSFRQPLMVHVTKVKRVKSEPTPADSAPAQ
jgi:hypothetical protein